MKNRIASFILAVFVAFIATGCVSYNSEKLVGKSKAETTIDPMPGVGEIRSVERTTTATGNAPPTIVLRELRETPEAAVVRLRMTETKEKFRMAREIGVAKAEKPPGFLERLFAPPVVVAPVVYHGRVIPYDGINTVVSSPTAGWVNPYGCR